MKVLLLALALPALSHCTDLDEVPWTSLSPDNFYKTPRDLEMAVNTVYGNMQAIGSSNAYNMILETLTEFNSPAYEKDDVHLWNAWIDVQNPDKGISIWTNAYRLINNANVVLGRGEGIEMDETLKKQYYGEVRFIRAWAYFHLVRIYGGAAIPESFTVGLSGLEIPRKSIQETYEYIIADLEYAESVLPAKSGYDNDNVWRVSKGAAQGLLAKVYLTMGSMQESREYFQKCKEYCDKVIKSGEYALEEDFKDLWYWFNLDCKNGKESLFEIQYGNVSGETNGMHIQFGVNVTEPSLGSYMYRRMGPSIQHYLSYSDDDARKEGSFLTEYTVTSTGERRWFDPIDNGFYPGGVGNWTTASPGVIKYYDRTATSSSLNRPSANVYVIRYADILLSYAEAENQLNGPTEDALAKFNAVRTRAGLEPLSGMTQQQLDDYIYRERGWEFIGESLLYFDGIRTGRIGPNVKAHLEWSKQKEGKNSKGETITGIYMYTWEMGFKPTKNFLWKIPKGDLDSNPALEQNLDSEQGNY